MNLRHCFTAALGIFLFSGAGTALAADYSPPPPPAPEYRQSTSCHYFRADFGAAIYERPSVTADLTANFLGFAGGGTTEALNETISDQLFVEGGWGCQFTESLRAEVTGGWRLRESVRDPYSTLSAELQTYTGMVNFFYDITNYAGWTPYVGAGIGAAYHEVTNIIAPVDSANGSNVNFAWNVQAGVSYDLTDNFKVDFGYRYADLGDAAASGPTRMQINNIVAHEFKFGLRWHVGGFGVW